MRRRGDHGLESVEPSRPTGPVWAAALGGLRAALDRGTGEGERAGRAALDAAAASSARAHGTLVRALEGHTTVGEGTAAAMVEEASELLLAVSDVVRRDGRDPRARILEVLEGCLRSHEADVLAGELTYEIAARDAQAPAVRTRRALALLRASDDSGHADLLSLQVGAVDLAALLLRAAGNLAAANRADGALGRATIARLGPLRAIALEIAARAEQVRGADDRADPAAVSLCWALRVALSVPALPALAGSGHSDSAGPVVRERARNAWLSLAAHEHQTVAALNAEMSEPAYAPRFPTLTEAVIEGAGHVLHGGRLLERPAAFRHRKAWRGHALALSHAIEAYVRAVRGEEEGLARVQLIVLTRLVRAAAAIVVLDRTATPPHHNGHTSRGARGR